MCSERAGRSSQGGGGGHCLFARGLPTFMGRCLFVREMSLCKGDVSL